MTREEFASTLKAYRRREHLTQEAAALLLGVSLRTWQNWEIARNMPHGFGLKALLLAIQSPEERSQNTRPPAKSETTRASDSAEDRPPAAASSESAPSGLEAHLL